jgi:hypothetical protein
MKNGDPILIEVDGKWRRGSFLAQRNIECAGSVTDGDVVYKVGIGEPHYFNYEEKEVYPHSVKRFIPLSEEDATAKHQAELPQAFALAEAALAELLPGETIKVSDGSILGYNGGVTLDPVVYDAQRIVAVQETAGWQVHVVHYHYATRHQPEEYEPVMIGGASDWRSAVRLFIETIFSQKAHGYWEHLADNAMAQAWADGVM